MLYSNLLSCWAHDLSLASSKPMVVMLINGPESLPKRGSVLLYLQNGIVKKFLRT